MELDDDDDTPASRPTTTSVTAEADVLGHIQLCFIQLAEDTGRAAGRLPELADADRADVLSLYRRRVEAVTARLQALVDQLAKA